MIAHKKTALCLILLVGLASCQPPRPDPDYRRVAGHHDHGEAAEVQRVGPAGRVQDHRQAAISSLLNTLVTVVMGFVRPLLTNLGIGTSNAILATMMRRRLALLPEASKSLSPPKLLYSTSQSS